MRLTQKISRSGCTRRSTKALMSSFVMMQHLLALWGPHNLLPLPRAGLHSLLLLPWAGPHSLLPLPWAGPHSLLPLPWAGPHSPLLLPRTSDAVNRQILLWIQVSKVTRHQYQTLPSRFLGHISDYVDQVDYQHLHHRQAAGRVYHHRRRPQSGQVAHILGQVKHLSHQKMTRSRVYPHRRQYPRLRNLHFLCQAMQ